MSRNRRSARKAGADMESATVRYLAWTEAGNDGALYWAVVQKRRGIGLKSREAVGRQLVYMTLEQYALLLNHGMPLGPDTSKNTDENEGTDDD